jgi:uncharacterized membrane protein YeaQ/YmgE (transglycosylase-associated protein family)
MWTILAFIVIGMVAGWAASVLIRHDMHPSDWQALFLIGVAGSLTAGIIVNLAMGEGFKLRPGGIIGSIAVSCLLLWLYTRRNNKVHARRETAAGGAHRERKGGSKHHTKR